MKKTTVLSNAKKDLINAYRHIGSIPLPGGLDLLAEIANLIDQVSAYEAESAWEDETPPLYAQLEGREPR